MCGAEQQLMEILMTVIMFGRNVKNFKCVQLKNIITVWLSYVLMFNDY